MVMKQDAVVELTRDVLYPAWYQERQRLDSIDKWYRWSNEDVEIPRGSTTEHKSLLQLAKTPWLGLVVTNVAQSMYVDNYRTSAGGDDEQQSGPWRLWNANDLDGRQSAIHRAALAYGQAYATALPGKDPTTGGRTAVLRGVSPRKMLAFYADPAEDDWPLYAIRVDPARGGNLAIRVYDEEAVYYLGAESGEPKFIEYRVHGVGECPVVRYTNMLDLDGRTDGEVEPFIPLAKRIDKTTYDRLLTQHFNSWKVRTVSGLEKPDDDAEAAATRLKLAHDTLLVADGEAKFGVLAETQLDGFLKAYESDIKTLAAASQTPVHAMVGDLINLSAEALAAARASLDAKVAERQRSFGKAHSQLLRIGSHIAGDAESAADVFARVTWADTSIRSLAEAADALGKFATMLGVPVEALWSRIPGVTKSDVEEWKAIVKAGDPLGSLLAEIERAAQPPVG